MAQSQLPAWATYGGGSIDRIDLANLAIHFSIPIIRKKGDGLPFNYSLQWDNQNWAVPNTGDGGEIVPFGTARLGNVNNNPIAGTLSYDTKEDVCLGPGGVNDEQTYDQTTAYGYTDPSGVWHAFVDPSTGESPVAASPYPSQCYGSSGLPTSAVGYATDGSGYVANVSGDGASVGGPNGIGYGHATGEAPFRVEGPYGNAIWSTNGTTITDTLGVPELTISGSPSSDEMEYAYPGSGGATDEVDVHFTDEQLESNMSYCDYDTNYGPTATWLPTEIDLPDGTSYTISYETVGSGTNGRVSSIALPTGAVINYQYVGDNNCTDGNPTELIRSITDNGTTLSSTTYTRSGDTTQVLGPSGNLTVYTFDGTYQSERQVYQGKSANASALMLTTTTCFSGSGWDCSTGQVGTSVAGITQTTILPDGEQSQTDTTFSLGNGGPTSVTRYDWAPAGQTGAILSQEVTQYAYSTGDQPSSVKIENAAGTVVAETDYTYTNTYYSQNGTHPSTISYDAGATPLTETFTYNHNGTVATATGVNGTETSYTYGTGSCDGAFPTSITGPPPSNGSTALTTSMTWDCNGGVLKSETDANGNTTTWTYDGPYHLWRPSSVTDPAGNVTSFTYTPATSGGPEATESTETFNDGASTTQQITTYDGMGRPVLVQQPYGTGTDFRSIETQYGPAGNVVATSVPFSAAAGGMAPAGTKFTTVTYDALGRPLTVTEPSSGTSNGTVTYAYDSNDTLITRIGTPNVAKQLQYNALGQVTSVCEVTTKADATACGQSSSAQGYWTDYTRNPLGEITSVEQYGGSSSNVEDRTFNYDELGRLTSETTPAAGTTTFTYADGNLATRTDADGNVATYSYDDLHRLTGVTYTSGTGVAATPSKTFVYDAATVDGAAMGGAVGRLAEAYTTLDGTRETDLGFSYGPLGNVTRTYESTPDSGGWYQVAESYQPNGAPKSLGMTPGVFPAISFGLNAEGRIDAVDAASGQDPVTAATYGLFGTQSVALGSGDSDAFAYYPATGQFKSYTFDVDSVTDTGTYAWNPNGTLDSLDIVDNIAGTSDSQNCAYTQDDLGRIAGVDCSENQATKLTENFAFDPYGNLQSNGSSISGIAFSAAYTNNRINGQAYDADGNLEDDPVTPATAVNAYNAAGEPVKLENVDVTYDALGRAVEAAKPSGTVEFVYAPSGAKLAVMSGQTLEEARIPLPNGGQAVYDPSGIAYYTHADELGDVRLASTPSRTLYASAAYSPYGAAYDAEGQNVNTFTGMTQDIDATFSGGQYDFPNREYNAIQGRWWTPDPAGLAAVNPNDPQSWNRYAYVSNTPMTATDPLGLNGSPCGNGYTCTVTGTPIDAPFIYDTPGWALPPAGCPDMACFEYSYINYLNHEYSNGGGGGGGGGATPTPRPKKNGGPALVRDLACAANNAEKVSAAGVLHDIGVGGGVAGAGVDALAGNPFSAATDLALSLARTTGQAGGHGLAYNATGPLLSGRTLGLAPPGADDGPIVKYAQKPVLKLAAKVLKVFVADDDLTTLNATIDMAPNFAANFVEGAMTGKFVYDAGTYGGALALCVLGLIH